MLIENFSQYPAIRSEIPADMQCLKDPSGSITYNEMMVHEEMSPGEFPGEFQVQVTIKCHRYFRFNYQCLSCVLFILIPYLDLTSHKHLNCEPTQIAGFAGKNLRPYLLGSFL